MKRNKVFVDSSAFIALNDPKDQNHTESSELAATLNEWDLITSDAVLTETYNILRYRMGYHTAYYFLKTVLAGDPFTIAEVPPPIRKTTLQMLEHYNDHKISYCDALSVAIMKQYEIQKIFAFDYHFEIVGRQLIRR